jgi:hypothetical protein
MLRNRHAADRLADLRDEIRRLQAEADQLRAELMAPDADLCGAEFEAFIQDRVQDRIDVAAAIRALGRDALRPFLRRSNWQELRLRRRHDDRRQSGDGFGPD